MISLIVVNYRSAHLTARAVRSVLQEEPDAEVVVVDNSADPSHSALLAAVLPEGVRLQVSERNVGFGAACNLGLEASTGDPVMLLNPDAYVLPGALKALRERLDARPGVGAVAPQVLWDETRAFLQPPGRLETPGWHLLQVLAWRSAWLGKLLSWGFRTWSLRTWRAVQPVSQSMLSGCAILLRRATIARVGGLFDERFFMFYEDADLSLRLRKVGLALEVVPSARVVHGWRSEQTKSAWMTPAREQYFSKHHPRSVFLRLAQRAEGLPVRDPAEGYLDLGQPGEPLTWCVPPAWRRAWLLEVSPSALFVPSLGLLGSGPAADLGASVWSNLAEGTYFARLSADRLWPEAALEYRWRVAGKPPTALLEWLSARSQEALGSRTPLPHELLGERPPERLLRRFGLRLAQDGASPRGEAVKVEQPNLVVGAADPGSAPALMALFSTAFGKPIDPSLWQWKYGGRGYTGVAAWRGERAVAHYGWIPRHVSFLGERLSCAQSCDVMTAPGERGNLSREGPYFAVALTFCECLTGAAPKWPFSFGFPSERHARLGQRLGIFHHTVRIMERVWECTETAPNAANLDLEAVECNPYWAGRLDRLWEEMRESLADAAVCERDHRYFFWRFLGHPTHRYACVAVSRRRGGALLGVVVTRDHGDWVELVDVVGALPHLPMLVAAAARGGCDTPGRTLRGWVSETFATSFGSQGQPPTYAGLSFVMVESAAAHWRGRVGDRWFVMAGDTDFH